MMNSFFFFFWLGNNVQKTRDFTSCFYLEFFTFSLEDALNILSSFLSDCACPTGCIEGWGLTHEMEEKQSAVFSTSSPHAFLMRYYELGQTTGHVFRVLGSDGTNRWVGQTDETDHLWMCGISSNVPPLLICCINSFKSWPTWRREGKLLVACSRGGIPWQRGALSSCCVNLSFISEFRNILFHFTDAFWNQILRGCIFVVVSVFFSQALVIGTKELDHASKGSQFCLIVECPLMPLLWSIPSFCPFCHSFS